MTVKKLLSLFAYLLLLCVFWLNIFVIILFFIIRAYLFFVHDLPFELDSDDLIRYMKAATFCGIIITLGCACIYYQRYRQNRNR